MPSASWMTASEVTTTWMSRMAMNIPRHMAAKPAQVVRAASGLSAEDDVIVRS